jgi:uncharacterized repeat protein (TIGR03803 family)
MRKLTTLKRTLILSMFCAAAVTASLGQVFKTLAHFGGLYGAEPTGSLLQGVNGGLYGVATRGGANKGGTVFEVTPAGLSAIYGFCQYTCANGDYPDASLVEASNGNYYGTAFYGGGANESCPNGCGTIFQITPQGKLTTFYSFCSEPNCSDGAQPAAALVQAANGNFYGTTYAGGTAGSSCSNYPFTGCGTVFEITPTGKLTTLYSFCSRLDCTDGADPDAGLVQATNGNFYGTTYYGGAIGAHGQFGTVFEITPAGQMITLYSFCSQGNCTDGATPAAGLVHASNGNLYGTTVAGGADDSGTVFAITPAGQLTTLYSFCSQPNCSDGEGPGAGLVQATDGNLYGTTLNEGANYATCFKEHGDAGCGTIFEITLAGQLTTLYSFCSQPDCRDGVAPNGLVQATNGTFYGTSNGLDYQGTVFSLSVGLGPFVETLPTSDNVGAEVGILGNNLTGATSVTFNGTSAQFTVKLPTLILTHVPTGATTGTVQVALPTGTLSSNMPFHVIP